MPLGRGSRDVGKDKAMAMPREVNGVRLYQFRIINTTSFRKNMGGAFAYMADYTNRKLHSHLATRYKTVVILRTTSPFNYGGSRIKRSQK